MEKKRTAYACLYTEIREILLARSGGTLAQLSQVMIDVYWKIGERLSLYEERAANKELFSARVFPRLAKDLTKEFGQGFTEVNLRAMRRFYQNTRFAHSRYPLPWAQYLQYCSREAGEPVGPETP